MTTEQIVKALRVCGRQNDCIGCECEFSTGCFDRLMVDASNLIEQQAARIAELEAKVPRWMPVEERLPENGVPVLVNYIGNNYGKYHPDAIAVWTDYGCFWWEGSLEDCYAEVAMPITHWMPLPGWPEEET